MNNSSRNACCILLACITILLNLQEGLLHEKDILKISHRLACFRYDDGLIMQSLVLGSVVSGLPYMPMTEFGHLPPLFSVARIEFSLELHEYAYLLLLHEWPNRIREQDR